MLTLSILLPLSAAADGPPLACTLEATPQSGGTLLRGMAVPNGGDTYCWFDWGVVGDDYPNSTSVRSIGSGSSVVYITSFIAGVTPRVQYHYRLVCTSSSWGGVEGAEKWFGREEVVAWGDNTYGQSTVPAQATSVVAISAGGDESLALKSDGTVVAWGDNTYGQTTVPAEAANVVAIAAGGLHSLASKSDGTVVAWGYNLYGQTTVPAQATNVVAISAGQQHSLALKSDGTVVAWGLNVFGVTNVPAEATNVVAIAAGGYFSLALKSDGTVVAWGTDNHGQTNVPPQANNVVAVAAGYAHSLALKSDGTVVAWGDNYYGQTNVPAAATNVVAIAAGFNDSLALRSDGTLKIWGGPAGSGNLLVPAQAGSVVAIAAAGGQELATIRTLTWNISFSGGNLVLAGSDGVPFANYTCLSATNLAHPVWVTNFTGVFGATGAFSKAIPADTHQAGMYFRLRTP